jgi:hypothetical protein
MAGIRVRRAYAEAKAGKYRAPLLQAIWTCAKDKVEAEKVLRAQPPYKPNTKKIIIDVTHFCNLKCRNCNRSCAEHQANVQEHMTVEQIKRFVEESVSQRRRWSHIMLEGGEPTLNPHILEIVDELVRYKRKHSPKTRLFLCTNGYAKPTRRIIEKMPPGVCVLDSAKESPNQEQHRDFNVAPIDLRPDKSSMFENGCVFPTIFGIGLNRYGYYPHAVCGGIDRVFGLDVGRKFLPDADDDLSDIYPHLCRYCGHFWDSTDLDEPAVPVREDRKDAPPCTISWSRAYSSYQTRRPELRLY